MSLLVELSQKEAFTQRHIGPTAADQAKMCVTLGVASVADLMNRVVPDSIRLQSPLNLDAPRTEADVLAELRSLADTNSTFTSFIGQGWYGTLTPNVILRNVLENPAWYTAYTPYQPEISQGRLEALLNYQTMIAELTGLDIANASLLDEATAGAEAMTLARRQAKAKSEVILVDRGLHPQTIALLQTRAEPLGLQVRVLDLTVDAVRANEAFAGIFQYPDSTGAIVDRRAVVDALHERGAIAIVASDLLALALLSPPGEWGADIVIGSAQRFGVPFGFGGPHAGFMACRDSHKRAMPGRLVGVSVDANGAPALRLAMQTREQHIRREKATSNICTAQVLLAIMASFYAVWHGPEGLRTIARRVNYLADLFSFAARGLGYTVPDVAYFDTVRVLTDQSDALVAAAATQRMNLRRIDAQSLSVSFDETHTADDLIALLSVFAQCANAACPTLEGLESAGLANGSSSIPQGLRREGPCLQHGIFSSIQSETDMLRYIRRLSDKDLALDRAMIPLGSCTMKLNATVEMIPITWPGFANVHPFAPQEQTRGYQTLITRLEHWLAEITGYDAVSFQPNSGAQGEYAGLLAIRAWHRSRGEAQRDVVLIPTSAHGTNPASAQMVGYTVVPVACDAAGNVDLGDLDAQIQKYCETPTGNRIAALMVTYPSTHGVYEEAITLICDKVHAVGGQVYLDGANLNALVGLAKPGKFGADVSHLNLHKTFCIPHGGGGPGVGPVAVRTHLAPYLPSAQQGVANVKLAEFAVGAVSAAPYGSAGILPISYAYIALMGASGLQKATETAILNANYIAKRLSGHYEVLYSGQQGLVAHECILDTRPFKDSAGVSAEDIAKRLIDYGFHAPTMSFPVAGTLMVEPTESESLGELDRFCDAMIAIREEIRVVEQGGWPQDDNPLHNAPHTAEMCLASDWNHPYGRNVAAYAGHRAGAHGGTVATSRAAKYWPPVARVDNVYGDRNLICACVPMSAYAADDLT